MSGTIIRYSKCLLSLTKTKYYRLLSSSGQYLAQATYSQALSDPPLHDLLNKLFTTDKMLFQHSANVMMLSLFIASQLEYRSGFLSEIALGGLFHDVGKIHIPSLILHKPSRLSQEEFEVIRLHPQKGYELIQDCNLPLVAQEMVLYHHQSSGYPEQRLKGKDLAHLHIIAIADAYEAMTSQRPYQKAKTSQEAFSEIRRYIGTQFHEFFVDIFLKAM